MRIDNNDNVALNQPPADSAIDTAVAFAKMWDPVGRVGWNINGPGHGFTLVNMNNWQGAVVSAPLPHLGFHAPLLLTNSSTALPSVVSNYLKDVNGQFTRPTGGQVKRPTPGVSWGTTSFLPRAGRRDEPRGEPVGEPQG